MSSHPVYCYIMANQKNGTLYVGVTSDLIRRVYEHKQGQSEFTQKYNINRLVWFEIHTGANEAITREKQLKKWKRAWKIELIDAQNPEWDDLYPGLLDAPTKDGCLLSQA